MRNWVKLGVLALTLSIALTVAAQDSNETVAADACVAATLEDWSPPQTLEEALNLRAALEDLIAECGAEAVVVDDTAGSEDALPDAQGDFPQTMYVSARARWINVRGEPATTSTIVATMVYGDAVNVLARVAGESYRGNVFWFRARVDEADAYIHSTLLSETKPAPTPFPTVESPQQPQRSQIDNCCLLGWTCNTDQEWTSGYWAFQNDQCDAPSQTGAHTSSQTRTSAQPTSNDSSQQPPEQPESTREPTGPLIFIPLTEEEWEELRRKVYGED